MRGERPGAVALIANAVPEAVSKRDTSGLTPFHWLWIRYISTRLTLEDGRRGVDATIMIDANRPIPADVSDYVAFAILEQSDFDADLHLINRMDPPADFLRMRHIPVEVVDEKSNIMRADHSADILKGIRTRHLQQRSHQLDQENLVQWSRDEVVTAFFWTKVVSLLQASIRSSNFPIEGRPTPLVHQAFANKSCLAAVAHMASTLFPHEKTEKDGMGRLPIHYAVLRPLERWDFPNRPKRDPLSEPLASRMLHFDSLRTIRVALDNSPPEALAVEDNRGCLPLHYSICTLASSCANIPTSTNNESIFTDMFGILRKLVHMYPDSLSKQDGVSGLYPFLLPLTVDQSSDDNYIVSMAYELLKLNPSLLVASRREHSP